MARTKNAKVPEVGAEVPEFNLPSAQGGVLRLGMRTATGPVIVVFFRGGEEDVSYFKELAGKEDEINLALGDVVGVGVVESAAAREFAEATGMKSYILYDYAKVATPAWGLLERDKKNGDYARAATFLIGTDNKVVEAWMDDRPNPAELLAKITEITGLPKEPEEDESEEKPKKEKAAKKDESAESGESGEAAEKPKSENPSPEEREKRRSERKAARGSGAGGESSGGESVGGSENDENRAVASGGDAAESAKEDGSKPEAKEEKGVGSERESGEGATAEDGESLGEKKEGA